MTFSVFTTGGIGPTHGDITADCVAKAFGVSIDSDPRALAILHEWMKTTGAEMNEARLRLTGIPKGADLILNKVSGAPGFLIGNAIVMADVPSIHLGDDRRGGRPSSRPAFARFQKSCARMHARATSACNSARSPRPILRSRSGAYPFFDPQHGPNTNVVLRARDAQKLALAKRAVEDMLERVRGAQSRSG